ncbi:DUF4325 domain-containing protein [Treponema phagedenis]|uniref:STAS-like domain-containing protein n=1 Tax=Treponema phagedenis TaxID=162 RepID=UPI0011E60DBD|nr:STAS-like domain-containing protein [Treponema phagedenis]QEJ95340.1 DUF4325 domain-containing protein [Treponema phagedenis]
MKTLKIIECDSDYRYQGGRFVTLSPCSGEAFRETYLIPFLEKNKNNPELCVDFSGTVVYTPSFLEECFGGAIRKGYKEVRKIRFINIPKEEKKRLIDFIKKAYDFNPSLFGM